MMHMNSYLLEGAHHVQTVLHNLRHCHLITFEDALDLLTLANAERVLLGRAHSVNLTLGYGGDAVDEGLVRLDKLLQHGLVVQNLRSLFCHFLFLKCFAIIIYN